MTLKLEIDGLRGEIQKLTKSIHSLEVKIGNTDVAATLDSDAKRISQLEEFQTIFENWMKRIENILDTTTDAKWTCPNCGFEFENLTEFLEHIIANINEIRKQLDQHLEDKTND